MPKKSVNKKQYKEESTVKKSTAIEVQGKVLDVVVDIRYGSPTFGKWTSVLLTQSEGNQLFVPRGFAHGFVSLEDNSLFQYNSAKAELEKYIGKNLNEGEVQLEQEGQTKSKKRSKKKA